MFRQQEGKGVGHVSEDDVKQDALEPEAADEAADALEPADADAAAADVVAAAEGDESAKKKKKEKKPRNKKTIGITVCVIVVVIIAAGAGFWVWHEQPSFCGAICHTPMDEYLATYSAELGEATTDKWGNEVEDSSAMMATLHAASEEDGGAEADCLDCHTPVISEQISEGLNWVTGSYIFPLDERDNSDLTEARGSTAEELCLNDECHSDITVDDLVDLTADMGERNPHTDLSTLSVSHASVTCTDCHKGHRASVMYCTGCHSDAEVPDGWLTVEEESELTLYLDDEES